MASWHHHEERESARSDGGHTTLHQYVPLHKIQLTPTETDAQVGETATTELLHKVLFGGDLLTVIRAKGAQRIRQNSRWTARRIHSSGRRLARKGCFDGGKSLSNYSL